MCSLKCGYCGTLSLSAFLIEFSAYLADQMLNEILWSFIIYIPSIWNLLSSEFLFWKRHVPFEQRQSISTTRFVSYPGGQLNIILKYMLGNIYKNDINISISEFSRGVFNVPIILADSRLRGRLRKSWKSLYLSTKTVTINSWFSILIFPEQKSKSYEFFLEFAC